MKTQIADWILSQVLPPDRAATMVGDWMEDAEQRGNVWFWSCVVRTTVSRVLSDFIESPRPILWLTFRASFFSWMVFGVTRALLVPGMHLFTLLGQIVPAPPPRLVDGLLQFLCGPACVGWNIWVGILTGCWIARRAPGSEIAVCLATSLMPLILIGLPTIFLSGLISDSPLALQSAVFGVNALAGALWPRRRQFRPATR